MAALLICLSAILISGDPVLFFAALFGAGIPIAVLAIRRWRLGPLGQAGIAALAAGRGVWILRSCARKERRGSDTRVVDARSDFLDRANAVRCEMGGIRRRIIRSSLAHLSRHRGFARNSHRCGDHRNRDGATVPLDMRYCRPNGRVDAFQTSSPARS